MHLGFQSHENKRKGIGSAKPHGDERQRNRKEAAAVTRFRNQVFEERVMRQKMKPEQMGKRTKNGRTNGRKEKGREQREGCRTIGNKKQQNGGEEGYEREGGTTHMCFTGRTTGDGNGVHLLINPKVQ